jgi:1-acyl-sn-glycerol-3-phosphate acyltransferase
MVTAWISPTSPFIERITRGWSRLWLALTGTRLDVRGDVADRSRSYIVISNHGSWLDIMANFIAVPLPIRFLAKKELFEIPLMGRAMRALGMVEIDRARAASMHEAINDGVRKVAAMGDSVMVYPEGTRTRTGEMQAFKRGAFFMAIDNHLPILPVTISGSYRAWPPGPIARGGTLTVEIGDPIETDGMTRESVAQLLQDCEALIRDTKARLDGEVASGAGDR